MNLGNKNEIHTAYTVSTTTDRALLYPFRLFIPVYPNRDHHPIAEEFAQSRADEDTDDHVPIKVHCE